MKKIIICLIFLAFNYGAAAQICTVRLLPKDTVVCPGQSITLKANATGTAPIQYTWTGFPQATGQTLVVSPANSITYYVSINTGNGCLVKDSIRVVVYPKLLTNFTFAVTDSCSITSKTYQFFNANSSPNVNYRWDFGDGGISVLPSPSHIYTAEGTYSTQLPLKTGVSSRFNNRSIN